MTVVQTVDSESPDPRATCLAGFCPTFALRTHPKKTSSTLEAGIPARLSASILVSIQGHCGWRRWFTFHGVDSQVDGCERGEGALEGADRGSRDGGDVDFGHFSDFFGGDLGTSPFCIVLVVVAGVTVPRPI